LPADDRIGGAPVDAEMAEAELGTAPLGAAGGAAKEASGQREVGDIGSGDNMVAAPRAQDGERGAKDLPLGQPMVGRNFRRYRTVALLLQREAFSIWQHRFIFTARWPLSTIA